MGCQSITNEWCKLHLGAWWPSCCSTCSGGDVGGACVFWSKSACTKNYETMPHFKSRDKKTHQNILPRHNQKKNQTEKREQLCRDVTVSLLTPFRVSLILLVLCFCSNFFSNQNQTLEEEVTRWTNLEAVFFGLDNPERFGGRILDCGEKYWGSEEALGGCTMSPSAGCGAAKQAGPFPGGNLRKF